MDDKERSVFLFLFPDDAQRQIRELFPWADDYTIVRVVTLKTITLDDGTTLQVGGNSEDCEILAVKPTPSLLRRPVIETDADEALNKAMEELPIILSWSETPPPDDHSYSEDEEGY